MLLKDHAGAAFGVALIEIPHAQPHWEFFFELLGRLILILDTLVFEATGLRHYI